MKKLCLKRRHNDNMITPKHVAIIMDGNGRWGLKKIKQEIMAIFRVLKLSKK